MDGLKTEETRISFAPQDAKKILVLRNPKSGAGNSAHRVESLVQQLSAKGFAIDVMTDLGELVQAVTKAQSQPSEADVLRAVVAAGGDGTVSLLVNHLPPQTPLAILPLGTENLLAKHLGITSDPKRVAETICAGKMKLMDAGRANQKLFMVTASCGFDADVVQRLHRNRSGHISHWSYALPIVNSILKYRFPKIRISLDSGPPVADARWAFVFNVPRYAMNLPLARQSDPHDGRLDLCTFRGGGLFRGLFYLTSVILRAHQTWTSSQSRQAKTIRLESDEPVPFQLDGDPAGELPVEFTAIPDALKFFVP